MKTFIQYGSLFALLFMVTLTIVGFETGSLLAAAKVGMIGTPAKWVVAHLHAWFFHGQKKVAQQEPEYTI